MMASRPLHTLMARLAWLAIALMLCAPLLTRALQAPGQPNLAELCTSAGLQRLDLSLLAPPSSHVTAHAGPVADGGHAQHGGEAACDYCLLAVRLLPLLALVLALGPLGRVLHALTRHLQFTYTTQVWPAHPARGPPLAA
ncbi:MAG TPA: DUF2946 family protein [Stenotrophomonas sp.]|nr:DUF2946 family protein [Stenotrophomonas sp.]